jgi:hypothetical protein
MTLTGKPANSTVSPQGRLSPGGPVPADKPGVQSSAAAKVTNAAIGSGPIPSTDKPTAPVVQKSQG